MPNPFAPVQQTDPSLQPAADAPTGGQYENTYYGTKGIPITSMAARLFGNDPAADFQSVLAQALSAGGNKGNLGDALVQVIQQNPHLLAALPPEAFNHGMSLLQTLGALKTPAHVNQLTQTMQDLKEAGITAKPEDVAKKLGMLPTPDYSTTPSGMVFDKNTGTYAQPKMAEGETAPAQPFIDTIITAGERSPGQTTPDGKPLVSPKGAVGIAQVLPETAQAAAQAAGIPWDPVKFARDADYNRSIGSAYLDQMGQKYDGNETLAAAAYNAGPARVDQWLKTIGDPRTGNITDEDWAAKIPITETRDYVKRVMSARGAANPVGTVDPSTEFQVVGDVLVKTSKLKGTAEPVLDMRKPDELTQKINYNISNGADPTLAVDLALGNITLSQDPTSQQVTMVNKRTRETTALSPDEAATIHHVLTATPAEQQAAAAGTGTPTDQGGLGTGSLETFAKNAPGIINTLAAGVSNTIGQIPSVGLLAGKVQAARENIRQFVQIAKAAVANNPRFPVAEQNMIEQILPDTSIWTAPNVSVQRVSQLRDLFANIRSAAEQQSKDPAIPAAKRQELLGKVADIDAITYLMGPDPRVSTPSNGAVGDGSSQSAPIGATSPADAANLKSGTWFTTTDNPPRILQRR